MNPEQLDMKENAFSMLVVNKWGQLTPVLRSSSSVLDFKIGSRTD